MIVSCAVPRSWILRQPSASAPQETEILFGHSFRVEDTQKRWAYGQALSPLGQDVAGYKGWIKRKDIAQDYAPRSHYVAALKAPVFKRKDIKSPVTRFLPLGAHIGEGGGDEAFCELSSGGYIHRKHLSLLGDYTSSDFVETAEAHLGLPYVWGGISTDGLDCSGLVQSALRAVGQDCLRDAGQQEETVGEAVDIGRKLRRGDLVFWPGHVGIMADSETLLHANAFHMKVAVEPFKAAAARIGVPRQIKRLTP